ncbi:MAG: sensor histidine kinase [Spirochaetia bacterium]
MESGRGKYNQLRQYPFRIMMGALLLIIIILTGYFTYNYIFIQEQILKANDKILNLINENIIESAQEARTFAYNIGYSWFVQQSLAETDIPNLIRYNDSYYQIAGMTIESNLFIDDIAVFNRDLSIFRNAASSITYIHYKEPLQKYLAGEDPPGEKYFLLSNLDDEQYLCYVMPLYELGKSLENAQLLGYCLTSFSLNRIDSYFRQVGIFQSGYIAIRDSRGSLLLFGSPPDGEGMNPEQLTERKHDYIVNSRRMSVLDASLVSFLPLREIRKKQAGFIFFSLFMVGVLIMTMVIIAQKFNRTFSIPLKQFVGQLKQIDGTDREIRISGLPDNEIGYISHHVNSMLDKIHDMGERHLADQKQLHILELHKTESELLALQAQINPHFMYNTLECIRSVGLENGSAETVEIVTALADILRYCLGQNYTVMLIDEIDIVREYLTIIKNRFGSRYTFSIDLPDSLKNINIIKMIIQPLVENAVFHGLENCRNGELSLTCRKIGKDLHITVKDTGKGIHGERLSVLRKQLRESCPSQGFSGEYRRSIGIFNIHNRIQAFYKGEYGLSLDSFAEEGTTVTVRLPAG